MDQSELRRHTENLEDALVAMIELWRSGQVGASTPAIYGLSSGCATISLIEGTAQEEETNGRAGAKGTETVEKENKLA